MQADILSLYQHPLAGKHIKHIHLLTPPRWFSSHLLLVCAPTPPLLWCLCLRSLHACWWCYCLSCCRSLRRLHPSTWPVVFWCIPGIYLSTPHGVSLLPFSLLTYSYLFFMCTIFFGMDQFCYCLISSLLYFILSPKKNKKKISSISSLYSATLPKKKKNLYLYSSTLIPDFLCPPSSTLTHSTIAAQTRSNIPIWGRAELQSKVPCRPTKLPRPPGGQRVD